MTLVWFLVVSLFVSVCQTRLRPGGKNVLSSYESYTTSVEVSTMQYYYTRTCWTACTHRWGWCWRKERKCRNDLRSRWGTTYRYVTRYRPVYRCKSGWKQSSFYSSDCSIAKCYGCSHGGSCLTPYTCTCKSGWSGSRCRTDLNECSVKTNPCSFKAYCKNVPGSYRCSCPHGFSLNTNGKTCDDINECYVNTHKCNNSGECQNTQGSYKCVCPTGYYLGSDERTCYDTDECSSFQNICGVYENCQNTLGSYACSCKNGYYLDDGYTGTCKDIDECDKGLCHQGCSNTLGGYFCSCYSGFRENVTSGNNCTDINECMEKTSGCTQNCINTQGSFRCSCNSGYSLSWDKRSCIDIDECNSIQHGCNHICQNTPGRYNCQCREGFDLDRHGSICLGRPCFPILAPEHGNMTCSGYSTEDICQFACPYGFELVGSRDRTCTSTKMWSGEETKCRRLHCQAPPKPENGFISSTCTTHVGSRCLSACHKGYYMNGSPELTCTINQSWELENITCLDIDECFTNQHGCAHMCKNTDGSYKCHCREGFTMSTNARSCVGRPCVSIAAPLNGHLACSGYLTEDICRFSCSFGYKLLGSRNRTCQPNKMWSGNQAKCKRLYCPIPADPTNGFIHPPCTTHAGSRCLAGCEDGYYVKGTAHLTCTINESWEPENIKCLKKTPCFPNPCQHSGKCSIDGFGQFHCDCSETGYEGTVCEKGKIEVPVYPILAANVPSKNIAFQASIPDESFTLTPASPGVRFRPPNMHFTKQTTGQQTFSLISDTPGLHSVRYYISGSSSSNFEAPQTDTVLVRFPRKKPGNRNKNRKPEFPVGCYQVGLAECPRSGEPIVASSTEPWEMIETLATTNGAVTLSNTVSNFPYSLTGASFNNANKLSEICVENLKNTVDPEWLIKKRVLTESFLKSLHSSLPKWLVIKQRPIADSMDPGPLVQANVKTSYYSGSFLREKASLKGQPLSNNSYYSFLASSQLNVIIYDEVLSYGLRSRDAKLHLSIEICTPSPSNIIIRPSPEDARLINDLSFVKRLKQNNWSIKVLSVQLSKRKTINSWRERHSHTTSSTNIGNDLLEGNMAMVGSFSKLINITDTVKLLLEFQGTVVISVENIDNIMNGSLDQKWEADLLGNMQLTMKFPINGRLREMTMKLPCSKNRATFTGKDRYDCLLNGNNREGFTLKGYVKENPFAQSDFDQFVELDIRKNVSCFVSDVFVARNQSNSSEVNNGMRMDFKGNLKFGSLVFNNLDIKMEIKHWRCINTSNTLPQGNVVTNFNGNFYDSRKKKLGVFEIPLGFNTNLSIVVENARKSRSSCSFQAIANVLGFRETVTVTVSNDRLRFSVVGDVHGLFNAFMKFESNLASWDNQRFSATGTFVNKDPNDNLRIRLEDELKKYVVYISKIADYRLELSFETEKRMAERLKNALFTQNRTLVKLELLQDQYQRIIDELSLAKGKLRDHDASFQSSSDNVKKQRKKLENLCSTKICVNLCTVGAVCCDVYSDKIEEKKSSCLGTCHATIKLRKYVVVEKRFCLRERCSMIYPSSPFFLTFFFPFFPLHVWWHCSIGIEICPKPVIRYQYLNIPYGCSKPCTEKNVLDSTKSTLCTMASCGTAQEDIRCKMEKHKCLVARNLAIEKMLSINTKAPRILKDLTDAQSNVSFLNTKKQKLEVKLLSARRAVNATKIVVLSLEKAKNRSEEARKKSIGILKKQLKLRELLDETQTSLLRLKIKRIGFLARMSAIHKSTLLRLYITYTVNGTQHKISTVLDFHNLNTSLKSIAREILSQLVGDEISPLQRQKRSIDFHRGSNSIVGQKIYTLQTSHELCSEFLDRQRIILEIIQTLHKRANNIQQANQNVSNNIKSSISGTQNNSYTNLNQKIASEFGLDIYKESLFNAIETDPGVLEVKELQQEIIQDAYEPIRSASKFFFENWLTSMQTIFVDFSKECIGFEDCFKHNVDRLLEISDEVNRVDDMNFRDEIIAVWQSFSNLTRQSNITVEEVVNSTRNILKDLVRIGNNSKICAVAPNITEHPIPYKELRVSERLILTCNATGTSLVYQWKFDGEILKNQSTNVLRIDNTTPLHSGSYVCEVSNHIDKVTSNPSEIFIGSAPIISRQPEPRVFLILSNYDSIVCQIEKNEHNISYQWWFKALNSDKFVAVKHGLFSYLSFTPVKMEQQGWYLCNISNKFGFTISRTSFVKVLNYSIPVPTAIISFTVIREYREANDTEQLGVVVSNREVLQNGLASSYPFMNNASNVSSAERIKHLTPVWCQVTSTRVNNKIEICDWKLVVAGQNSTRTASNDAEEPEKEVTKAVLGLKGFIKEVENATETGQMSFFHGNEKYSFQKGSVTAKEFNFVCRLGQALTSPKYVCANCPSGSYGKLEKRTPTCEHCPIGFFQEEFGKTYCIKCTKGFTTFEKGSYEQRQCEDERQYFVAFKLVNNYPGNVFVKMTVSSVSKVRLLSPGKSLLRFQGWKTKKSVTLTVKDQVTNKTIYINGQPKIRIVAEGNVTSLTVLYISGKSAEQRHDWATFVLVSIYHSVVRVKATVNKRTHTFVLEPRTHAWFLNQQQYSNLAILRNTKWVLQATDIGINRTVYINGQNSIDIYSGRRRGSQRVLYIHDLPNNDISIMGALQIRSMLKDTKTNSPTPADLSNLLPTKYLKNLSTSLFNTTKRPFSPKFHSSKAFPVEERP